MKKSPKACWCLPLSRHLTSLRFFTLSYINKDLDQDYFYELSPMILTSPECYTVLQNMCSVTQSYLTLCGPVDCSPPGSSVHGISQARILEWVAISCSRGSSQPRLCASCIGRWILYHWPPGKPIQHVILPK